MGNTGKRLTIAIATYNRAKYIGKTIENIQAQMTDDVELLIVDGASTDNTESVVGAIAANDSRIRYVRLPAKGGVDFDYSQAVEMSEGEYCWLFTDDDFLKPGAVQSVLNSISEGHELIVVNLDVFNPTMDELLSSRFINLKEDKVYHEGDFEEFFTDTMHCLTFIGSVVIKKMIWQQRQKEKFFGTEFIHVGVIFQKKFEGTIKVIAEPLINYRYGMAQWTTRGFSIWMFKWPELVWSFSTVSEQAKRLVAERFPWKNLWTLLIQKSLGTYNQDVYKTSLKNQNMPFFWKATALTIALIPGKIVVALHYLYCLIRGKKSMAFFRSRG